LFYVLDISFLFVLDHASLDFEKSKLAKAYADLKFVYVITCQIYGQQKAKQDPKATDILYLLKEYVLLLLILVALLIHFCFNQFVACVSGMKVCGWLTFMMLIRKWEKNIILN
jgi:hypothetical protein